MAIDYRSEVDSGYDRKRIVESLTTYLLREGIPLEVIIDSSQYNIRHNEMLNNLSYGHRKKEEEITERYNLYGVSDNNIVGHNYDGVAHPDTGELYPMDAKEEREKFKLRDDYLSQIDKLKNSEVKRLKTEKEKIQRTLIRFRGKKPVLESILMLMDELDSIKEPISNDNLEKLFKRHGLDGKKLKQYNLIYSEYDELNKKLEDITLELTDTDKGIFKNSEIRQLELLEKELETEILQRNVKLVNGFIRQKYPDLLVETEDLFQVCYIAMWEAFKKFDYTRNFKFSTYAYNAMDMAVKHNFKALTGYSWINFFTKRKIEKMLKYFKEEMHQEITVSDLVAYGLIDMSEKSALGYMSIKTKETFSDYFENLTLREGIEGDEEINDRLDQLFLEDEILQLEKMESEIYSNILRDDFEKIMESLTDRQKLVINLRFGLIDGNCRTLDDVAKMLGVTRERVRQIEAKALRMLRHPCRSGKIRGYLD